MSVLVYLFRPLTPSLTNDHKITEILFGRRRTHDDDEAHLQLFFHILSDLEGHDSVQDIVFEALHKDLPFQWCKEALYDTVNPFGDMRQVDYKTLWTFNIVNGTLLYTNRHCSSKIRLDYLRSRPISLPDFEYLGPPVPSLLHLTMSSSMPYWIPDIQVDERTRAFSHRILCDFNHQWRHIIRNNYNIITLRVFARALIRLATLQFEVREETRSRHGIRGNYVWITDLPKWRPFEANIVLVGKVYVITCHSVLDGISMAQKHANCQEYKFKERANYMVLSVRHIVLCRVSPYQFEYTTPLLLLNGDQKPSSLALDYLIWATADEYPITRLHILPCELQNNILQHATIGPVAAARLGCVLGLGSPFVWKDCSMKISLEETYTNRTEWSPVESQLWFQESQVGIVYRGRT
jgi:hypothetical protein